MPNSPATSGKPDGYPYITRHYNGRFYAPIMVDWSLETGAEQITEIMFGDEDPMEAKRLAVNWATRVGVPYKAAIHG